MDVVTREDLRQLVGTEPGVCVSIYQPAHRAGPDSRTYAQKDPTRLKNLTPRGRGTPGGQRFVS